MNKKQLYALFLFSTTLFSALNATEQVYRQHQSLLVDSDEEGDQVPTNTSGHKTKLSIKEVKKTARDKNLKSKITSWFKEQFGSNECTLRSWLKKNPSLISNEVQVRMKDLGGYYREYAKEVSSAITEVNVVELVARLPEDLQFDEDHKGEIIGVLADAVVADFEEEYEDWEKKYKEDLAKSIKEYDELTNLGLLACAMRGAFNGTTTVKEQLDYDRAWDRVWDRAPWYEKLVWAPCKVVDIVSGLGMSAITTPEAVWHTYSPWGRGEKYADEIFNPRLKKFKPARSIILSEGSGFKYMLGAGAALLTAGLFMRHFDKVLSFVAANAQIAVSAVGAVVSSAVGAVGVFAFWGMWQLCPSGWGTGGKVMASGAASIVAMLLTTLLIKYFNRPAYDEMKETTKAAPKYLAAAAIILLPLSVSCGAYYGLAVWGGYGWGIYIPVMGITYYGVDRVVKKFVKHVGKKRIENTSNWQIVKSMFSAPNFYKTKKKKSFFQKHKIAIGAFTAVGLWLAVMTTRNAMAKGSGRQGQTQSEMDFVDIDGVPFSKKKSQELKEDIDLGKETYL